MSAKKVVKGLTLGKIKIWASRLRDYVGWAQFPMVFYMFLKNFKVSMKLVAVISVIILAIILYVDVKYVMPSEFAYHAKKYAEANPEKGKSKKNGAIDFVDGP